MKRSIKIYTAKDKYTDKVINYIPLRYIVAILVTILEIVGIIGSVALLAIYVPYFYIALFVTEFVSIIALVVSNDNPDYKIAWLFFVVTLPLVGLMLYLIFHKRTLPKRTFKKLAYFKNSYSYNDQNTLDSLNKENDLIATHAKCLCKISNAHLYQNTKLTYYSLGESMHKAILEELKKAEKFILLEYFIIEEGIFWNSILDILKEKSQQGIEVKVVYDDIGCMGTLPGRYYKTLKKKYNIDAVLFSKLRGQADGEFNNRSHRKILVIDGKVGFTGGINIADEYINQNDRLGHWKDTGIKLQGKSVNELTKLFLTDYYLNVKQQFEINFDKYYCAEDTLKVNNYVIPFGDGPRPIYNDPVGKTAIMNLLNQSKKYVYITTPYLIVDNEMMRTIENTAKRGVDVRIILPHIPDKKFVFRITKSNYQLLIKSGVKIYEYSPGFIHAKSYISDDKYGIIGTINLDYRSLTHHFENGVWIYKDSIIIDMKKDFEETLTKSEYMNDKPYKNKLHSRLIDTLIKIFSPLL